MAAIASANNGIHSRAVGYLTLQQNNDGIGLTVDVPPNTQATIHVPAKTLHEIHAPQDAQFVEMKDEAAMYQFNPGSYHFSTANPSPAPASSGFVDG